MRHVPPVEYAPVVRPPPEEYYNRRQVVYEPEYVPPPRERVRSFRELPSHRMPDFYNNKYEDEAVPPKVSCFSFYPVNYALYFKYFFVFVEVSYFTFL